MTVYYVTMISSSKFWSRLGVSALSLNYGFGLSIAVISVTFSALAARSIGMDSHWSTTPYGLQFVFLLIATLPSAWLFQRFGRKIVFVSGCLCGFLAGLAGFYAMKFAVPFMLILAHALIGITLASVAVYRFAAVDLADKSFKSSAVSLVILGGVLSALVGPEIARSASKFLPGSTFAAAYLAISLLSLSLLPVLLLLRFPTYVKLKLSPFQNLAVGFRCLKTNLNIWVGVLSAAGGFGLMNLVMISSTIAMRNSNVDVHTISYAVQYHVLAMFVPSIFMGRLIDLVGEKSIIILGTLLLIVSASMALIWPDELKGFHVSLIILGIAWNMMYVAGSVAVAKLSPPEHSLSVQGLNEFIVGVASMFGAFTPGIFLHLLGWQGVNVLAAVAGLIFLIVFGALLFFASRQTALESF